MINGSKLKEAWNKEAPLVSVIQTMAITLPFAFASAGYVSEALAEHLPYILSSDTTSEGNSNAIKGVADAIAYPVATLFSIMTTLNRHGVLDPRFIKAKNIPASDSENVIDTTLER